MVTMLGKLWDSWRGTRPELRAALAGSVVWLAFWSGYLLVKFDRVMAMEPNEFGDFLAGAFTPLAMLWLIAGYFLQARELSHQVDSTAQLASAASDQLRHATAISHPSFELRQEFWRERFKGAVDVKNPPMKFTLRLRTGGPSNDIEILLSSVMPGTSEAPSRVIPDLHRYSIPVMNAGESKSFMVETEIPGSAILRYRDTSGVLWSVELHMPTAQTEGQMLIATKPKKI